MNWKKGKPTEHGFYWTRYVYLHGRGERFGVINFNELTNPNDLNAVHWHYGPIEPPTFDSDADLVEQIKTVHCHAHTLFQKENNIREIIRLIRNYDKSEI